MLNAARKSLRPKKLMRLKYDYGDKPILNSIHYDEAKNSNQLEELAFKPIRFAKADENNSPLNDRVHSKFLALSLRHGKKDVFSQIYDDALYRIKKNQFKKREKELAQGSTDTESDVIVNPIEIMHKALQNCTPLVITDRMKRGGATYQVPVPINSRTGEWFAYKWIIAAVKDRPRPRKKRYDEVMAYELLEAARNEGKVVKKKDDMHKQAEANRAYAHYRWA